MTNQTKIQMLVALLLLWGGAVVFQFLEDTESPETALNTLATVKGSKTAQDSLALAKSFNNPRQSVTLAAPRNIFTPFNLRRDQHASSSKQRKTSQKKVQQPASAEPKFVSPPGPSPEELAFQRAQQQLNKFRFLGYLKKGGESQAFLTKGESIYIVKQGETVEGRIVVNRIDPTLVILSTRIIESGNLVQAEIPLTKDAPGSSPS
ncbi:MAG: hypothetical protein NPIRA04_35240 [Nitrospirales bacterium]|nr:MAG: hypothetical protein NPIRA04_35240 [Nitrospirales bacterium]